VAVGASTLISSGSVKIVEAFMLANGWLFLVLACRGRLHRVSDIADVIVAGTRGVMAALLIVALAYALNAVTIELGAGQFMIQQFTSIIDIKYLIVLVFLLTAAISFSTGTSWGAYAMMMPVALPVAFEFSDGSVGPLVYQTVAAIAGGGIFGDHASPVSDTTVLSSVGAGSDHIDHVITQLPYALVVAAVTAMIYLWI
jgi:Na+/H+ antiporter NhaC